MDFDSPDVEKEFPGLYETSGRKNDDDFSESGDHDKISKKELLLGRRKEKKDKKCYATLDGESSSPEDDVLDTKSPSKSTKKSKAFKFPMKNKEKREKSRDKDKSLIESRDSQDKDFLDVCSGSVGVNVGGSGAVGANSSSGCNVNNSNIVGGGSIGGNSGTIKEKKKEKEKKDKEKKEKSKDKEKDKKDKKLKQAVSLNEEILDLGDAQPIFNVSLGLAVERSRCHDQINLPLVVRDCIDYLQEFGLQNEQIYKIEVAKSRLYQLKKIYNNRESNGTDDFDVAIACGLLKLFLKELPEPILTTDLTPKFEEVATISQVLQQEQELSNLINLLPGCHRTLLSWILLHLDDVIKNEKYNKLNAQNIAMLLAPTLQMSNRLLIAILCHCCSLFADTKLHKYIPPITASSPNLPEHPQDIVKELKKQESLLNQIHAEMNAGFVTKKREEQLWEVQRIITQLKRKLRSFEKKQDLTQKSLDDSTTNIGGSGIGDVGGSGSGSSGVGISGRDSELLTSTEISKIIKSSCSDDEALKPPVTTIDYKIPMKQELHEISGSSTANENNHKRKESCHNSMVNAISENEKLSNNKNTSDVNDEKRKNQFYIHDSGLLMLPETDPDFTTVLRLQLENAKLIKWKTQLDQLVKCEQIEMLQLKNRLTNLPATTINPMLPENVINNLENDSQQQQQQQYDQHQNHNYNSYDRIIGHYVKENALWEQKKNMLVQELFEEHKSLIQLEVELAIKQFQY